MAADTRRIVSTLFTRDPPMERWNERVRTVSPAGSALATLVSILRSTGPRDTAVLDGSGRHDQLVAAALRIVRPRMAVVIADCTWKLDDSRLAVAANRIGVRLIDGPRTTFCVLSRFELASFPHTWGPLRGRMWFTPWPATWKEPNIAGRAHDDGYVFAGGNSLRDYTALLQAAPTIDAPVQIATTTLTDSDLVGAAPNVTAGPLSAEEYDRRLIGAGVVAVMLQARADRSSGQTTYANAMALGKPIVITDTPGVRDYMTDGVTAMIVAPGDAPGLAGALQRLIDDPDLRRRIGLAAREHAEAELTLARYADALLAAVDASS